MEKINKIIKQIQAVQFNEEGIISDSGMRTLDNSIKELKSLKIVDIIPSPEPSMNTVDIEGIISILDEKLETASFPHLYISGKEETAKAIAQLFNQQPALAIPTEDEIDGLIKTICSLEDRVNFYYEYKPSLVDEITKLESKQRKAIIELIKSKQL